MSALPPSRRNQTTRRGGLAKRRLCAANPTIANPRAPLPRLIARERRERRPSRKFILYLFAPLGYPARMPDDRDRLPPATAEDVTDALAFGAALSGP
jgi:hypothetical protein